MKTLESAQFVNESDSEPKLDLLPSKAGKIGKFLTVSTLNGKKYVEQLPESDSRQSSESNDKEDKRKALLKYYEEQKKLRESKN